MRKRKLLWMYIWTLIAMTVLAIGADWNSAFGCFIGIGSLAAIILSTVAMFLERTRRHNT